jgi:hypothetical protein
MSKLFRKYYVVTPEYDYTEYVPGLEPPGGPTYSVSDCIEVEAANARYAKAFGVKLMLQKISPVPQEQFSWCKDQRSDGLSPYSGVYVEDFNDLEES